MEQPSNEHRAAMLREGARQIRKWVEEVCSDPGEAAVWLKIAELREKRAEACSLMAQGAA